MTYRSLVTVDFPVISTLECLVAEEVDGVVLDTRTRLFSFYVLEAVSLIPPSGENVKGDLTSNGVCEAIVWELLLQCIDQVLSNVVFLIVPV